MVKDGPDVKLFNHPAALTKLALWIGEALSEQEREAIGKLSHGGRGTPLVVASLNEKRGVYVVVGTGGGGGPDTALAGREAAAQRRTAREKRTLGREEARLARAKAREDRRSEAVNKNDEERDEDDSEEGEEEEEEEDDEESDADTDDDASGGRKGFGLNRFGAAFQEVVGETKARVRIDSFEHSVVEVKKEDLGGFLESLSVKAVVG